MAAETRDRILDAALMVISKYGACRLTIDAVVKVAKVSKGGVLYHFRDKDALLEGLLDRHMGQKDARLMALSATYGDSYAGQTHASIELTATRERSPAALPMLGILALEPRLLNRFKKQSHHYINGLRRDGDAFPVAMLIMLANTGLIVSEVLETIALTASERKAIIRSLHALADTLPGTPSHVTKAPATTAKKSARRRVVQKQ